MSIRIPTQKTTSTRLLLALGFSLSLSYSAICGWSLWQTGNRDYLHHRQAAANLISSVAGEIDRNIELYDLSLQAVVDGMKLPDIDRMNPEVRQLVLFDRAATARGMGSTLVLSSRGDVKFDSRSLAPEEANYESRDFFQIHVNRADIGLFISRPWITRDGQYLISFSQRITNSDGSFGGVVVGSMRMSYFHDLFKKLAFSPDDSINLLSADGTILMRMPFDISSIGQSLRGSSVFKHFPASRTGHYDAVSIIDGVKRLFVYQQIGDHPLIIINGVSFDTIYSAWRREVWIIGVLVASLCTLTMVVVIWLASSLKRQAAAEKQLAILASTDGLTGLSNRRRFDEVLASEWRRSQRTQSQISLLMIDADRFKAYNDAHGHQAGDEALVAIASCIANGAQRASDLSARYGGEEFAVLLPGTAVEDAIQIAENIRASVLSLREQQQGRPDACPTISIGVATMTPQAGLAPYDLVKSADRALYNAKREGRDRTVVVRTVASVRHDLAA